MKTSRSVAIAIVITAVAAVSTLLLPRGGVDPNDPTQVARGENLYRTHCASCHGVNLEGEANWRTPNADGTLKPPPHDASGHTWHHPAFADRRPDKVLFTYTKLGGQAAAPPGFKSAMPGFGDALSDTDIWAVLAFIKSRWSPAIRERQRRIDKRDL